MAHKLPGTQGCLPGFDVFSPRPRGASYHSQDGQHGGCVPHKPSRRFTVAHPGHSTRGVASSQALFRGVPLEDICVAAGWSSPRTFVKFYNLDVDTAPGSQILSI